MPADLNADSPGSQACGRHVEQTQAGIGSSERLLRCSVMAGLILLEVRNFPRGQSGGDLGYFGRGLVGHFACSGLDYQSENSGTKKEHSEGKSKGQASQVFRYDVHTIASHRFRAT
jgi:hypothetical protein